MSARKNIIPIFVPHWGCPHNCVFCNQNRITGEKKPATAEDVKRAIAGADSENAQVAFYGGSFTAIPASQQEELLEAANGYSIRLSTRPDCIDDAVLKRLEKYGVDTIELGAQSLDNEVLRLAGRGHTAEDVENASKLIKSAGFNLILQMMTGLPGDTEEKDIETAKKIIALKLDGARIYPTVIVKDTALFELWKKGLYKEHTVEDAVEVCSKLLPLFDEARIPVIRLGLNPTDDLSGGDAVAGAYHSALGELVKSRIKRNELEEKVRAGLREFSIPANLFSQYTGQHRCNILYFKEKYGADIKFIPQ